MTTTLTEAELFDLTRYKRPAEQLAELLRQGFSRARQDRLGRVILEREHYVAVCAGIQQQRRPTVRLHKELA